MARKLSHYLLDKNYLSEDEIIEKAKSMVEIIFKKCDIIDKESDFESF